MNQKRAGPETKNVDFHTFEQIFDHAFLNWDGGIGGAGGGRLCPPHFCSCPLPDFQT